MARPGDSGADELYGDSDDDTLWGSESGDVKEGGTTGTDYDYCDTAGSNTNSEDFFSPASRPGSCPSP